MSLCRPGRYRACALPYVGPKYNTGCGPAQLHACIDVPRNDKRVRDVSTRVMRHRGDGSSTSCMMLLSVLPLWSA
jgi:hypothetical protein